MELFEDGSCIKSINEEGGAARAISVREKVEDLEAAGVCLCVVE